MQAEIFAEAYPRTVDTEMTDFHADTLREAREWSKTFGMTLHDYLTGEEQITADVLGNTLRDYYAWNMKTIPETIKSLVATTDYDDDRQFDRFWRSMNELNFHALSISMMPMWARLADDPSAVRLTSPAHNDKANIGFCQFDLAAKSIVFNSQRRDLSSIKQDYEYFSDEWHDYRGSMEGIVTEYDTAIVLLEICKSNPNLVVVPGPKQFEDMDPTLNSDFVLIDTETREVTGIQAKGTVRAENMARYNPEYVALVDGRVDLGNTRYHRVEKGTSRERIVSWPGMISAGLIVDLPTRGPQINMLKKYLPMNFLMQHKLAARRELGNARPDLEEAVQKVRNRILPRLMSEVVEIA